VKRWMSLRHYHAQAARVSKNDPVGEVDLKSCTGGNSVVCEVKGGNKCYLTHIVVVEAWRK
jgi:hypothetical protein